ncbi:MAG: DUF998 domain-containing protein [Candidatus Dormibacteraeota bacterium]|nr:DUF998 domain-containing protein [Candidatus Dormibacteraeota bacterium]
MSSNITTAATGPIEAPAEPARRATRALLAAGMVAGPLFIVVALVQAVTRPGFDLRRHAISLLTLGDLGWVQRADFVVTGLLVLACAVGIRRALRGGRAGTWGPVLFGGYGLGLFVAGFFTPDPALGFPPGAPAGMATSMSWHALVHNAAFFEAFISLVAAIFVFARRFAVLGNRRWALYSAITGVAPFPLIALAEIAGGSGVILFLMGVITSAWVAAMPARLRAELNHAAG